MRLWHEQLLGILPQKQLLSQHRECCALRGRGWGKKHSTVNYVFSHPLSKLVAYHWKVMEEMERRGMEADVRWYNPDYRGKHLGYQSRHTNMAELFQYVSLSPSFCEHDTEYFHDCLDNLIGKLTIKLQKYTDTYGAAANATITVKEQLDKLTQSKESLPSC